MNKAPAYQHYAKEWLIDTAHLSLEEQGAYQRLLDHQWINGALPTEERDRAKLLSLSLRAFRRVWRRIGRFFPSGLNPRLEEIRQEQQRYRDSLSASGRLGAERRWNKKDGVAIGHANGAPNGVGNGETMRLQSASASAPAESQQQSQLHDSASRRVVAKQDDGDGALTFGVLMGLVRQHLYVPDGLPAPDWDAARDGSILKKLRKSHTTGDIAIAIEGLAILRDSPGVYADAIDWPHWPKPWQKTDLRALYNNNSGVLSVFTLATQAYWKRGNARSKTPSDGTVERIGQVLKRAIQEAP